ncbi:Putative Cyclin-like superfamily [Colletotrichum destructivum]|uniref:Cyclin-like superfamily n=1 Tax=Colletotrichum destructivum TaxID=34406 RepID=A0AAX4J4M8_9PEZI|nr:Putative Cyclin-like superfamily [Colletotrichum destructivum]WQF90554.1 Putative Cyclin-like superfamily [Colletotrichum destructivum]
MARLSTLGGSTSGLTASAFLPQSRIVDSHWACRTPVHRSAIVSCQSWLQSGVHAAVDHHQAAVSAPITNIPAGVERFEQFCRRPLPPRSIHSVVERFLARILPFNADIWNFPSGLEAFLRHLLSWADISGAVFCGSLIYLERAAHRGQQTPVTEMGRRLRVLAAIILARKYLGDDTYETRFWIGLTARMCSSYFTDDDIHDAETTLLEDLIWDLRTHRHEMYVMSTLVRHPDTICVRPQGALTSAKDRFSVLACPNHAL